MVPVSTAFSDTALRIPHSFIGDHSTGPLGWTSYGSLNTTQSVSSTLCYPLGPGWPRSAPPHAALDYHPKASALPAPLPGKIPLYLPQNHPSDLRPSPTDPVVPFISTPPLQPSTAPLLHSTLSTAIFSGPCSV